MMPLTHRPDPGSQPTTLFITHRLRPSRVGLYIIVDEQDRRTPIYANDGHLGAAREHVERRHGWRVRYPLAGQSRLEPVPHLLVSYGRETFAVYAAEDAPELPLLGEAGAEGREVAA